MASKNTENSRLMWQLSVGLVWQTLLKWHEPKCSAHTRSISPSHWRREWCDWTDWCNRELGRCEGKGRTGSEGDKKLAAGFIKRSVWYIILAGKVGRVQRSEWTHTCISCSVKSLVSQMVQYNVTHLKFQIKLGNIIVGYLSRSTGKSPSKSFPTSPSVSLKPYVSKRWLLSHWMWLRGIAPSTAEVAADFHSYCSNILSD